MDLAQAREIDASSSSSCRAGVPASKTPSDAGQRPQLEGLRPYPSTASGKLIRTIMAGLATLLQSTMVASRAAGTPARLHSGGCSTSSGPLPH